MSLFCDACLGLLDGFTQLEPHDDLRFRGLAQTPAGDDYNLFGCRACGTDWMEKLSKWGEGEGFRLRPDTQVS